MSMLYLLKKKKKKKGYNTKWVHTSKSGSNPIGYAFKV